jgi:predicted acetyltransferase
MSGAAVEVLPATGEDKAAIAGLTQFYVYDFSEWEEADSDRLDFAPDGLFSSDGEDLERYFTEPDREALIVRVGGKLAGFVLLNKHSHCGAAIDHDIGEFFVARKFRRGGTGSKVLELITASRPGRWEAAIARRNTPALAFWPRAIGALPGVRDITTTEGDGVQWRGPILHFTVGP